MITRYKPRAHARVMRSHNTGGGEAAADAPRRGAGVRPSVRGEESARAGGNLHCPMMRGVLPRVRYCGGIESRGRV